MDKDRINILVVDDEEGILDVTEGYFQRKGYEVFTAGNGAEALEVINREQIHCIFTDINMPVMDGLELAEKIRHIESTLPVVVMTGYPSLENSIQTLKNGVVDYLIKPVNLEQMELTLKRILRERELFIENLILKEEVERQERLRQLNDELFKRIDEVNTLNRIMEDFATINSIAEIFDSYGIFDKVVDLCLEVTKADKVFFHLYPEQEGELTLLANAGSGPFDDAVLKAYEKDIPESAKQYIIDSLRTDQNPCLVADSTHNDTLVKPVRSFMVVPLKIRETIFGVVSAYLFKKDRCFNEQDIYYMNFITQKAVSGIENNGLWANIFDNVFDTLYAFVKTLEFRDLYTRKHSQQVARWAQVIAEEMGCTEEELDAVSNAGNLHDIGKIGIRDDILLKPGRLTDEEYEEIKKHPVIGADIVGRFGFWDTEMKIIRHHHERYDGNGYPDGLKGDEIPKLARVLSVADCYDAMVSDRAYRKKMDKQDALATIVKNSGTQFDPQVVEAFLKVADQDLPDDF